MKATVLGTVQLVTTRMEGAGTTATGDTSHPGVAEAVTGTTDGGTEALGLWLAPMLVVGVGLMPARSMAPDVGVAVGAGELQVPKPYWHPASQ